MMPVVAVVVHEVFMVMSWFMEMVQEGEAGTGRETGLQGRGQGQKGQAELPSKLLIPPSNTNSNQSNSKQNDSGCVAAGCFYMLRFLPQPGFMGI